MAWPYYLNVLLLAYRRRQPDKEWSPQTWKEVLKRVQQSHATAGHRPFWYDRTAAETLACALLDALAAANRKGKPTINHEDDVWMKYWGKCLRRRSSGLTQSEVRELESLCRVLHSTDQVIQRNESSSPTPRREDSEPNDKKNWLPGNADVYLCWYSQLRDLIQRKPELAGELRVCSLPGGGFAGDWYLGIVDGSVSLALGRSIISILCSKGEQYKRLVRGVGLPALLRFDSPEFIAWPGADGVSLQDIYRIHENTMSRAHIQGYDKCRSAIVAIARALAVTQNDTEQKCQDELKAIVDRLFGQLDVLRGKP